MRALSLVFAAAVLIAAPVALAQTEPVQTPEITQPAEAVTPAEQAHETTPSEGAAIAAPEPELICRTVTARTESRLRSARERVCLSQAQWDAIEQQGARSSGDRAAQGDN